MATQFLFFQSLFSPANWRNAGCFPLNGSDIGCTRLKIGCVSYPAATCRGIWNIYDIDVSHSDVSLAGAFTVHDTSAPHSGNYPMAVRKIAEKRH